MFKKFRTKIKIFKFETKNVFLGIFRLKTGKNNCDILESATQNLPKFKKKKKKKKKCKKKAKTNKHKKQIWDQKLLIWVFWAVSLKRDCHI